MSVRYSHQAPSRFEATFSPLIKTFKTQPNIAVKMVIKIKVLPKLLFFSVTLFIKPTIEKMIIKLEIILNRPMRIPIPNPLDEIEFVKVFIRQYRNSRNVKPATTIPA